MIFKEIFNIFLFVHILSDFYFQTEFMAEKKKGNIKNVFIHCIVYALIVWLLLTFIIESIESNIFWIVIGSHFIFDVTKYYIEKKDFLKDQKNIFL